MTFLVEPILNFVNSVGPCNGYIDTDCCDGGDTCPARNW